jgi:hypothetical protein
LGVEDAVEIAAAEGDHQWERLEGQGQQATLAELGMNDVVSLPAQPAANRHPSSAIVLGLRITAEGKHVYIYVFGL